MEAELATLAEAGATSLVGLMVSDSWAQVKKGFARLLARGDATDSILQKLETARTDFIAAREKNDAAKATAIEDEWRSRLLHCLRSEPKAGDELLRLLCRPEPGPAGPVYNVSSGIVRFGSVIQAGQISGITYHVVPTSDKYENRGDDE